MSSEVFIGIDLGTSGVKCLATDARGRTLAKSRAPLTQTRPHPGWSEQVPEEWWTATCAAMTDLPLALRRRCAGLAMAGQMHGAVCLDADDKVLRPAILWDDGRSADACRTLTARVPGVAAITGSIAMPGFTAPKLVWMAKHEPDLFARTAMVLLPKDYLRLRMTGDHASDMSDAAGTLWLDTGRRRWSEDMLAATGLDTSHMPELFEGPAQTGVLLAGVAADWGMDRVPVAGGAGDNAAGAVGMGVTDPGQAVMSLGTSGTIFIADDAFPAHVEQLAARGVHTFCHALPGRWHRMSVMLSAARALDWAASVMGLRDVAALDALAAEAPVGEELFLPYLAGERTPHNDPQARGAFVGLSASTTPSALARAAIEGVAFGMADGWDALSAGGDAPARLSVVGGGSRSRTLGQCLADALDHPLDYRDGSATGPALGAARLARLALSGESVAEVCPTPDVTDTLTPSGDDALLKRRERFRSLYTALQPSFHATFHGASP